jgi:hypothetical protein
MRIVIQKLASNNISINQAKSQSIKVKFVYIYGWKPSPSLHQNWWTQIHKLFYTGQDKAHGTQHPTKLKKPHSITSLGLSFTKGWTLNGLKVLWDMDSVNIGTLGARGDLIIHENHMTLLFAEQIMVDFMD